MTNDEILQAAKDADAFYVADKSDWHKVGYCVYVFGTEDLERFAAIIEKRTIERCAVVCEMLRDLQVYADKQEAQNDCAAAIRKLGEQ